MSEIIKCPSGLVGKLRGMKAREERVLADRKLMRGGTQLEEILAACWEETLDAGPYEFGDKGIEWGKVLAGDRFFALLQVRVLSYGGEYEFSVLCENRACRARLDWELDLRELPVRALPAESRATFLAGNRFEARLPEAGRTVYFRLLTGADERRMATLRRSAGERPITTLLGVRIESIEGVELGDKGRFIENLGMGDVAYLIGEFDRVDCGVDTEIEVECPDCLGTTRVELPFDRGFLVPERRRRTKAVSTVCSGT